MPASVRWPALVALVCIAVMGVVFVVGMIQERRAGLNWPEVAAERDAALVRSVQQIFRSELDDLLGTAGVVRGHAELYSDGGAADRASSFAWLRNLRARAGISVDIIDSTGHPVLWAGRSVRSKYQSLLPGGGIHTEAFITRDGLQTYLSVEVRGDAGHAVVVSRLLESRFPISTRFLRPAHFPAAVFDETGARVGLELDSAGTQGADLLRIPLMSFDGRALAYAVAPAPQQQDAIVGIRQQTQDLLQVLGGIVAALLTWSVVVQVSRGVRKELRVVLAMAGIWAVRLLWIRLAVPAAVMGGALADASLYGSSFGGGLASTPVDLILSGASLLWSVLLLGTLSMRPARTALALVRPVQIRRAVAGAELLIGALVFVLFVRAFAAVLRSFLFDSTAAYQDPTRILPDASTALLLAAMALVASAFYGIFFVLVAVMDVAAQESGGNRASRRLMEVGLSVGVSLALLRWSEETPLWPWYMPFYVAGIVLAHRWWISRPRVGTRAGRVEGWRPTVIWLSAAFLVTAPMFYALVEERERAQVESLAAEVLRPADAWLSYLLTDGIRTVAGIVHGSEGENPFDPAVAPSSALNAWARMLVSRQGYNSGVFLYDSTGHEVDRFVVGIESYDQRAILTKLFDYGEETVQTIERTNGRDVLSVYGIWSTMRSSDGRLLGSVAIILSTGTGILPGRSASLPFRGSGGLPDWRDLYLTEYRDSSVVSTSRPDLFTGIRLGPNVRAALDRQPEFGHWFREQGEDRPYMTLYVRDPADAHHVLAVSITALDIRWYAFTVMKLLSVFALIGLLIAGAQRGWDISRGRRITLTVGQKLFGGFAIIAVMPLIVLGYYNRAVSTERVQDLMERTLRRDLEVVERRIVTYVENEDDFVHGVTDEFCRAVSAEYGTDFTVYRGDSLLATSRPELYRAALFDSRLDGTAYAHSVLEGRAFYMLSQTVGNVPYAVGFMPVNIRGQRAGVVSISTLYRQSDIEREVAERNVNVVGVYAIVVLLALGAGGLLAARLARPLQELSAAARDVARGDFDPQISYRGRDELGDLVLEFRAMASELKRSREDLAHAERERAWKEMAKQVAHEIRNPLTPIKLSVQHLRQAFQDRAADREEILQRVTKTVLEQIETLSRIALEFSHFARMPDARVERLNIHTLLDEALAVFSEVQGVECRRAFADGEIVVLVDHDQMQRVFVNIVRNSIQAMPKGGVVTVTTAVEGHGCRVRISDTGPGIPAGVRARIFEPNFSTKTEGMGIGLAIARRIVEDAGGRIDCESEPGSGTAFIIDLPVAGEST